ncbi:hypothetical protein C7293_28480 [filamentous cyanobacterium CCT1]|nr:hypothetical protein C7293_28480 [filamentous cyanobacterium CCT1]PSN75931.1 hypothetical protein C8B47_29980 [filamentous cyanobacterium CCP4]
MQATPRQKKRQKRPIWKPFVAIDSTAKTFGIFETTATRQFAARIFAMTVTDVVSELAAVITAVR